MFTISKSFQFSASHCLVGLAEDHPCMRVHGHNYKATFFFQSARLNENDFVIDYRKLDPIKKYIDNVLDHRHLNEVMSIIPTAENIANMLYNRFKKEFPLLVAVEVSETEKTSARYEPNYDI